MIPGKVKVTLEDIASRAGVSTAAVSQALSGKGTLSQLTRERILRVAEELAYQPDKTAQSLALRRNSQAGGKRLKGTRKQVPPPGVMVFYSLPELIEVVQLEIQQRDEEGFEVEPFREQIKSWQRPTKQQLYRLYLELLSARRRQDFLYEEPNSLEEIRRCRPDGPQQAQLSLTAPALYDRIYGAWLGRVAGCVLGNPLQAGWSKSQVIQYLQKANSYPLKNYIPRLVPALTGYELKTDAAGCFLGEINGALPDDDTDYTILTLHLLEEYGVNFTTTHVATEWLGHLAYFNTFTTERAIYRNLIWNIHPEEAACYVNPEREFIGARTRADLYGYIAPGKPELAAALAYRDASLSHTKNGVYSAMFMAAAIAWAAVSDDLEEIIRTGLSEIPRGCRLAEAIQDTLDARHTTDDWELAYQHLLLKYGSYSPIHTIPNTVWVILALLYGQKDFSTALGNAVSCGMDTGSNAASVGSVMGMNCSASAIPAHWIMPLGDRLYSSVVQFSETSISDLARRTAKLAEMVLSSEFSKE